MNLACKAHKIVEAAGRSGPGATMLFTSHPCLEHALFAAAAWIFLVLFGIKTVSK